LESQAQTLWVHKLKLHLGNAWMHRKLYNANHYRL
jgi:hypothetical protein